MNEDMCKKCRQIPEFWSLKCIGIATKKIQMGRAPETTITSSDAKKLFVVGRLVNALLLGPSLLNVEFLMGGAIAKSSLLDSNSDKENGFYL